VLNENVFPMEMIYEKKLSFWKENVICENDNIIKNMKLCMNAWKCPAELGGKGETKLPNSLAVKQGHTLNTSKL
jgi:hypothetical protein